MTGWGQDEGEEPLRAPKNRINKQPPLLLQILAVIKFTLVYETRAKANPGHID
uniref:HDC12511 n=1 Tax=Drosophila melanogaster TaxID=7227 RepID=Q6IKG2_DROME|nr:TPA_inf: HDC12511 [Drosophila melanogaster]